MSDLVRLEGDAIVIRVPIAILSGAAFEGLNHFALDEDQVDFDILAKDMVTALNAEEEDGTTLINRALDQALIDAFENGSRAVRDGPAE